MPNTTLKAHQKEPLSRDNDDASDADSDLEELQSDIAKFDESVREFLATHRGGSNGDPTIPSPSSSAVRGASRSRARGPRKAAKPRGDITARLSKVNQAFLAGDYPRALDLASEVVRINAETHQAWTAMASIFEEMGEVNKSLSAMVYAAHLRPKDVGGWLRCATFALDTMENEDDENLHTARLCYSAALRADSRNMEARVGKAMVCHRQGHLAAAINEYNTILKRRPHDLEIVRKLAEACIDNKHTDASVNSATSAYKRYFDFEVANTTWQPRVDLWHDVGIYVELFASNGRYSDAIRELKSLARWLVGRPLEKYWDEWQADDREWDAEVDRRYLVPEFNSSRSNEALYGDALPRDQRARLAIYRLGLGNDEEAFRHLQWLDPTDHHTRDFVADFPYLVFDIASELARQDHPAFGAKYLEVLREVSGEPDAAILLQLGRCYRVSGQQPAAEECFLSAIEVDPDSIESRIELANMYEKAREDEEALILAAEAMALRGAQADGASAALAPRSQGQSHRRTRRRQNEAIDPALRRAPRKPVIPRRYRPKRLGAPDQRRQEEQAHAVKLSRQYETVHDLKRQIQEGRDDLMDVWMQSSQELVDDFRSLKQFYSWDKYLQFLGSKGPLQQVDQGQAGSQLFQMYERLTRTLVPHLDQSGGGRDVASLSGHQGISFDEWLSLFLDYAVGLALMHRREDAYQVCEAARDSTVFQSSAHNFTIHVTWSVCAIYTSDEEKSITIARYLMKDGATTDSHRMFALLSSLCQSPITWYTSGPAQKYILRQIRSIDTDQMSKLSNKEELKGQVNTVNPADVDLDVCLLMLYGHILFTSTSYTYALGYFLRARALDPQNPMVNLSLGLAYAHYALKRQSVNRQYLVLQGLSFMSQYIEMSQKDGDCPSKAEMHYNIGRLYHLLGIPSLALRYYSQAASMASGDSDGMKDIMLLSVTNQVISLLTLGNNNAALELLKENIII
ncbi:hypothetical protein GMORB2_3048 [Geosmithia morbida]|uniref:Uncharacterized protein n=1 Tax=Geosmithia morbida TaxID=1094350 RepID=A0A9P4YR18_9HYPO|nr:uncharacterized protein GMORB2_3048 [Geosmithia morbida]KAF4120247.1 hypothetical protein GMORB2_3048 [Geosmithia morbida]